MSVTTIKNQIETTQNAPLDIKLTPVDSLTDLYHIPRSERYVSMTIFVKSENCEYWLVDGTLNMNWKQKINTIPISGDDI